MAGGLIGPHISSGSHSVVQWNQIEPFWHLGRLASALRLLPHFFLSFGESAVILWK